jgi:hypothetical protein
MAKDTIHKNEAVTLFLAELNHPLKLEIEHLRTIILEANGELDEIIKWNAPSYVYQNIDCITFKIYPPKAIQLIFHRGAKVKVQLKDRLIDDTSRLLVWKENDRALLSFSNFEEIKSKEKELITIIQKWINAIN